MTMEEKVIGRWLSEAAMCRKWCDVSILCGGRHFWAHRLVLSTASPFIRGLLLSRPSDDIPTTIVFADFSHEIVEALLQYIYSGEVSVLSEHVEDFLTLTRALQIHVDTTCVYGKHKQNVDTTIIKEKDDCLAKLIAKKSNGCIKSESCNKNLDLEILIKSDKIRKTSPPPNTAAKSSDVKMLNEEQTDKSVEPPKINGYKNDSALNLTRNIHKNVLALNYSSQYLTSQLQRNEKLVRPIPSLMPIDTLSSISRAEIKSPAKKIPDLLDLTSLKGSYNYNSAFERVNNYPAHSKSASEQNRLVLNQSPLFDYHKPLRLGFSNVPNSVNNGSVSTSVYNMEDRRKTSDFKVHRNFPQNKVMDSPWSARGPICYQRKARRKHEPDLEIIPDKPSQLRYSSPNDVKIPELLDIRSYNGTKKYDYKHVKKFNDDNNNDFEKTHKSITPTQENDDYHRTNPEIKNGAVDEYKTDPYTSKKNNFMLVNILENSKKYVEEHIDVESIANIDENVKLKSAEEMSSTVTKSTLEDVKKSIDVLKVEDVLDDACALKCPSCFKMFTSRATLATHAATHVSRARYRCDQCDKSFSQLRNYKYHVSVHKGTKEFAATCNVCGKYFNDRGYLSSHMKIHRNRKEYQCPHCPKSFNQRVAYNMHVRIHTGVKPHQCEACGKAFSRKMLLKQHSRTHSGEKPYACSACGKRFADRSNMTLHMRLHSGVKPFSCNLCPKSFTKKHHLKTHLNYHTGNKPYACSKCGLTFSQSSNMRTHMKKCSATMDDVANMTETIIV